MIDCYITSSENLLDITLLYIRSCIGEVVRVPSSRVVLGKEQGKPICHLIGEKKIGEFPMVKNPGYVAYGRQL